MRSRWKPAQKTKEPDNVEKAYDYAVFLLSLRLRTIGEVLSKMQKRGYTESVIGQVIERLKDQRYLDDRRYAEIFLENLKAYKNFGYYGIKKKFMEKKLPPALIETVLEEGLSFEDERKIAERLLRREGYAAPKSVDDSEIHYRTFDENAGKEKQKLAQRLKARGFRGEVISRLIF